MLFTRKMFFRWWPIFELEINVCFYLDNTCSIHIYVVKQTILLLSNFTSERILIIKCFMTWFLIYEFNLYIHTNITHTHTLHNNTCVCVLCNKYGHSLFGIWSRGQSKDQVIEIKNIYGSGFRWLNTPAHFRSSDMNEFMLFLRSSINKRRQIWEDTLWFILALTGRRRSNIFVIG